MTRTGLLRRDAESIWRAGVEAAGSLRLVRNVIDSTSDELLICGHSIPLDELGRVVVVGSGKAGAGMAAALEEAAGPLLGPDRLSG
ncbi:MAG: DUF4147 domain-containing protein, partial [Planctomycetes bacterium]|nr:DUF4147 domain-containing protein [Planctomycetota bacterium]